jgi:PIN domain nuclease of toxin-antitoxin system
VNLLLDTHVFLWWMRDPARLSERVRAAVAESRNHVWFSAVSAWEIVIKAGLGRLEGQSPDAWAEILRAEVKRSHFLVLPVTMDHALAVGSLPTPHTDPFDRLLIAQATVEKLLLVTKDVRMAAYPISVLW